jgi:uncharacterized protein YbjQ (UPF0145 family)
MNKLLLVAALAAVCTAPAVASDHVLKITLQSVLDMPEAKEKLDGSVKFYLAGSATPRIEKKLGEDVGNEKTNAVGKTAERACQWAALSDLIAFQMHAKRMGANAVVEMVSYYRKETSSSPTDIECHDGAFVTGVTLKGTYAKVAP